MELSTYIFFALFVGIYGFLNLEKLDSLQDCRLSSVLYYGLFMYFEVGQLKGLHFKPLFVLVVQIAKILVLLW
jgi:preprotein translocase subunit Sec61beta